MDRITDVLQKMNNARKDTPDWYDDKGKFKHYVLGRHILEHCHIKRIGGIIHIYSEEKRYIC